MTTRRDLLTDNESNLITRVEFQKLADGGGDEVRLEIAEYGLRVNGGSARLKRWSFLQGPGSSLHCLRGAEVTESFWILAYMTVVDS